jgi:hypothetical protein
MHGKRSMDGPIDPEQLRFLAAICTEWEDELHRRRRAEAQVAEQRKLQEFVNRITGPDWPRLEREPTADEVERFVEAITTPDWSDKVPSRLAEKAQGFVDAITGPDWPTRDSSGGPPPQGEAETNSASHWPMDEAWDSSKHPRRGGPPNAGWFAAAGGAGHAAGGGSQSVSADADNAGAPRGATGDAVNAATGTHAIPAVFSPSHGAAAHLISATRPGGRHWVPQDLYGGLKDLMSKGALDIFKMGTEAPDLYDHAIDTWDGMTHGEYSSAMRELLEDWIKQKAGKLEKDAAKEFLTWIAIGKCNNDAFLAKHKAAFATVFKWREGFKMSIVVAARAKELNPRLTGPELKAIAQQFVNGKSVKPLSRAAAKVAERLSPVEGPHL